MNKIAIRKIVLLSVIAVLAVIYIFQISLGGRKSSKTVSFEEEADRIEIVTGTAEDSKIVLSKKNDAWFTGLEGKTSYPADSASVEGMQNILKEIKLLSNVASSASNDADRYGLDEANKITVKAFKGEKCLRTLTVGKNTSTGNQAYVQVDGKNTVYLEDRPLHSTFSTSVDSLRSKNVYQADSSSVMAVKVTSPEGKTFAVARNTAPVVGDAVQSVWTLAENTTGQEGSLDDSSVTSWVNSISTLNVSGWEADDVKLGGSVSCTTVEISTSSVTYTVRVSSADTDSVLCASSSTPYAFNVGKYVAQRYTKELSSLFKK